MAKLDVSLDVGDAHELAEQAGRKLAATTQEVVAEGRKVLERVAGLGFCRFAFETFPWGAGHYLATGRAAPEEIVDILRPFDAIYMGAHGDPARVPDRMGSQQLMHPLRKGLDLYVNLRPVKSLPGVESPLKATDAIDFVVVRENTEGEYAQVGGFLYHQHPDEVAIQTAVFTRRGIDRVVRFAFELRKLVLIGVAAMRADNPVGPNLRLDPFAGLGLVVEDRVAENVRHNLAPTAATISWLLGLSRL